MTFPMVHLNGTAREDLVEGYRAASLALAAACRAIETTYPNGRDYYPQGPDALRNAEAEHRARLQRLVDVRTELESILDRIDT